MEEKYQATGFPEERPGQSDSIYLDTDDYKKIFQIMNLSRAFDCECNRILKQGKLVPHFHSGIGQEALMVASDF